MSTALLPHARALVRKGILDPDSGQIMEMARAAAEGVRDEGGAKWVLEQLKGVGHVIVRAAPDPWTGEPSTFVLTSEDEDEYLQGLSQVREVAKDYGGPLVAGELEFVALAHLAGQGPQLLKQLEGREVRK